MKNLLFFLAIGFISLLEINAQNKFQSPNGGGEVVIPQNTEPCISNEQRELIHLEIAKNVAQLKAKGKLQKRNTKGTHPLFIWPVSQADGFNYNVVWATTNYIDHNPAYPDHISDYECGTRSYDTSNGYNHKGFDIISWPFWWKQMELNQAINIAAADGQITAKNDGSFDENCGFNSDTPNYIAVEHSDGSTSWYLHMKNGGLTTKGVGDYVSEGEFLGVIGSSGSSTLPHLHFEVYDTDGNLIDPSIGPCNDFNSDTWWLNQKTYYNPQVNAAITHNAPPEFFDCPATEITNESNQFNPGDLVTFAVYLKDQESGTSINLKITKPDNTVLYNWDFALTDYYHTSFWYWQYNLSMEGTWKWETTYLGETTTHEFNIGVLGVDDNILENTLVYPNPANKKLFIESEKTIVNVTLRDILGRTALEIKNHSASINEIDLISITKGMYFVTLTSESNTTKTIKLIKK